MEHGKPQRGGRHQTNKALLQMEAISHTDRTANQSIRMIAPLASTAIAGALFRAANSHPVTAPNRQAHAHAMGVVERTLRASDRVDR
jgi:hypothetical protein